MPLETATYIDQLVQSNPAHSDGLNNADAHLRLIKGTIQATFPNFTAAALNSTQAQIDTTVQDVTVNGVSLLAAAVSFLHNASDGLGNPVAGEVNVVSGGTVSASFTATAASVPGTFSATGAITGPGVCPIGSILIWPTNTLPNGIGIGTFAWCNGAAISRTTYASLYSGQPGSIGTTYGAGDGSTTFNLPNYQEVALVGQSGMGGAASPGLLSSISSGLKAVLNGLFGLDTYDIKQSDLPNVAPTFTGIQGTATSTSQFTPASGGESDGGGALAPALDDVSPATVFSTFTPAGTISSINGGVTQTAMPTHQPSKTVNFIIRVA